MSDVEEKATRVLVCIGMRESSKGAFDLWWLEVENAIVTGKEFCFSKNPVKYARPGQVYTFDRPADKPHTINVGTQRYTGIYCDDAMVSKWQIEHVAAEVRKAEAKRLKDDNAELAVIKALEPVREAYRKTNYAGKRAMLASIIEYITR